MRALILSDIHANLDALDAVLAAAPPHDVVWNLGDVVGYGALPNETIERVRGLGAVFVRGNHDRSCCGLTSPSGFNPIAAQADLWTRKVLTPEHTEWLRQLPTGPTIPKGQEVSCVHGSLLDEDEYLIDIEDAWPSLQHSRMPINFFGHTHVQGAFAANGQDCSALPPSYENESDPGMAEISLDSKLRYLINPGSVGQPRDGDWRAAFAVYDGDRAAVEFHRVPYDVRTAQMRILRAGLPDRLAARLREGR